LLLAEKKPASPISGELARNEQRYQQCSGVYFVDAVPASARIHRASLGEKGFCT
jgi:hypothetical protein